MKFRNYSVPLKSCVGRVRSPGFLMNPSIRNRLEVGSEGRGDSMTNLSESGRFGDLRTVCAHAPDRGEVAANPDLIQRDEAVTVDRDHFSPEELAAFTAEYAENLARGKKQNPPIPPPAGTKRCPKQNKVRNLRDRLDIYRIETLRTFIPLFDGFCKTPVIAPHFYQVLPWRFFQTMTASLKSRQVLSAQWR